MAVDDAAGKFLLQPGKETLVRRVPGAEHDAAQIPPAQHLGKRLEQQVDALLRCESGDHAGQRHRRGRLEAQPREKAALDLGLHLQAVGIEVLGQVAVVPRVPFVVVHAVQDACQDTGTRPQRRLHAHSVLIRADLPRMRGAHGRNGVGVHDAVLQRVDDVRPQIVLVQQVAAGAQVQIGGRGGAERSLVADVVDRQHGTRLAEQLIRVVGGLEKQRRERRVPVVAVQYPGRPLHLLATGEHRARERQEPQVLVGIRGVQRRPPEELRAIDQIDRRARARERSGQYREAVAVRAELELPVLQPRDRSQSQPGPINGSVQRREQPDVVSGSVQILGEGRRDVRETAGF